jgi:hypothetical protein
MSLFNGLFIEISQSLWHILRPIRVLGGGMRVLACVALLLIASVAVAQPSVEEVRTWNGPERTRVVFDLSAPLSHELFMLSRPDRAVLDLHDADIAAELVADIRDIGPIERVRTGQRGLRAKRGEFSGRTE